MLSGKTVLITGGTGSFGKKFIEISLEKHNPKRLIVFSRDELKQHDMQTKIADPRVSYFIGDIRSRERLTRAFQANVDIVVHAAALKQVPACEYNPYEAIKTNILGAQNIIDAAIDTGVKQIIALSTDKAVNPANLYGATKLCMEKLFIQGNSYAGKKDTRFSCVRYGNVVGSRGSVVPIFMKQKDTGSLNVTDDRMTRFWITLEEGVNLVLKGLSVMKGGEIFIPRIPSMGLLELAKAIGPECDINITGIRQGEKLHEALISEDEARHTVEFENMFVIEPEFDWWSHEKIDGGKPLSEGFSYTSENNKEWLDVDQVNEIIENL